MVKELAILFLLNLTMVIFIILVFFLVSSTGIMLVNSDLVGQRVLLAVMESFIALIAMAGTWVMVPYVIHRFTVLLNRYESIDPIGDRVKAGGNIQWLDWFFTRRKVILAGLVIFVFFLFGFMEFYAGQLDQTRPVYVTAHRGDMIDAPENTMAALESAISKGADFAELDVQMLEDGSLILMHDDNFQRTTDVNLDVAEATLEDIENLNAGAAVDWPGFEPVPMLEDVLEASKGKIRLNLELKPDDNQEEMAEAVVAAVEAAGMSRDVVFTSVDESVLHEVETINPQFRTGLIVVLTLGNLEEIPVDFFSVEIGRVNEARVERIHAAGKEVHVWTVNEESDMNEVLDLGVDGLITDDVDLANAVLREREIFRLEQITDQGGGQ
jgi:glycerophosphoryl diester phosphodiesterase